MAGQLLDGRQRYTRPDQPRAERPPEIMQGQVSHPGLGFDRIPFPIDQTAGVRLQETGTGCMHRCRFS
jgi:hypothetical protein